MYSCAPPAVRRLLPSCPLAASLPLACRTARGNSQGVRLPFPESLGSPSPTRKPPSSALLWRPLGAGELEGQGGCSPWAPLNPTRLPGNGGTHEGATRPRPCQPTQPGPRDWPEPGPQTTQMSLNLISKTGAHHPQRARPSEPHFAPHSRGPCRGVPAPSTESQQGHCPGPGAPQSTPPGAAPRLPLL